MNMNGKIKPQTSFGAPEYTAVREVLSDINPVNHEHLRRAFREAWPAKLWQFKATGGEWNSHLVEVIGPNGATIATDAKAWLAEQNATIGSEKLIDRIKNEELRFGRNEGTEIYALGFGFDSRLDFLQICIRVQCRAICSLQNVQVQSLQMEPNDKSHFNWDRAERDPAFYVCGTEDIIFSLDWLERCKESNRQHRLREDAWFETQVVTRFSSDGLSQTRLPFLEAHPEARAAGKIYSREERWFNDWKKSSAGVYAMGQFWYLETSDYVDGNGFRHTGFIPQAVIWPRSTVSAKLLSTRSLMERLMRFDRKVKCPFGWYFYMVHGNRIGWAEGKAVARAVRQGQIRLESRDEGVLLAWDDNPYSF
jgi:hypothetical protein